MAGLARIGRIGSINRIGRNGRIGRSGKIGRIGSIGGIGRIRWIGRIGSASNGANFTTPKNIAVGTNALAQKERNPGCVTEEKYCA